MRSGSYLFWRPLLSLAIVLAIAGCWREPAETPVTSSTVAGTPVSATPGPSATSTARPSPTPVPPLSPERAMALKVAGQVGGASRAVAVWGRHAYLGIGPRLAVVDAGDPQAPGIVSLSEVLPGVVQRIVVQADRAWVAAGPSLVAFDLVDPQTLRPAGTCDAFPNPVRDLAIQGDLACAIHNACRGADCRGTLQLLDLADPARPQLLGRLEVPEYASGVTLSGHHAYLATWEGLRIVDVADPAALREVASCRLGSARSVAVAGGFAYVGGQHLWVLDVSDPAHPRQIGRSDIVFADDVAVVGDRAYVGWAFGDAGLARALAGVTVLNVSDPAQPREVSGGLAAGGEGEAAGRGVAVANGLVYQATETGLAILGAGDPAGLRLVGALETLGPVEQLALDGHSAYLGDGDHSLHILDVADPAEPVVAGKLRLPRTCEGCGSGLTGLAVADGRAYLALWADGLWTVDGTDPAQPRALAHLPLSDDLYAVAASSGHACVKALPGLQVLDLRDPSQPREAGFAEQISADAGLALADGYAYLAAGSMPEDRDRGQGALYVIDVRDADDPRHVGRAVTAGRASGVALMGGYAYVATTDCTQLPCASALATVDVCHPAKPYLAGSLLLPGEAWAVAVADGYAYVATAERGPAGDWGTLWAVDVGDPVAPRVAGTHPLPGWSRAVAASGGWVYVATGDGGLLILRSQLAAASLNPVPDHVPQLSYFMK